MFLLQWNHGFLQHSDSVLVYIPYAKCTSEKIKRIMKGIKTCKQATCMLKQILCKPKDQLEPRQVCDQYDLQYCLWGRWQGEMHRKLHRGNWENTESSLPQTQKTMQNLWTQWFQGTSTGIDPNTKSALTMSKFWPVTPMGSQEKWKRPFISGCTDQHWTGTGGHPILHGSRRGRSGCRSSDLITQQLHHCEQGSSKCQKIS